MTKVRMSDTSETSIGTLPLSVCPCDAHTLEKEMRTPGSPATLFHVAERRPVALRPTLSSGLPLSGELNYGKLNH